MKTIKSLPYKLKKKFYNIENTYNFYSKLLKMNTELHFRDKLIYNVNEDDYVLYYDLLYKNITCIQDYVTLYRIKNDKMHETEMSILRQCAKYEDHIV